MLMKSDCSFGVLFWTDYETCSIALVYMETSCCNTSVGDMGHVAHLLCVRNFPEGQASSFQERPGPVFNGIKATEGKLPFGQ